MKTLNLAAMALLLAIVAPVIVGYAWPSDTVETDVWTTDDGTDCTGSLATSDIPIIDGYTGPMNNLWLFDSPWYLLDWQPVAVSQSPSSIPDLAYTGWVRTVTIADPWVIHLSDFTGYRTDFYTVAEQLTVWTGDSTWITCSTVVYMPGSGSIYLFGGTENGTVLQSAAVTKISVDVTPGSPSTLVTVREYTKTGDYVDLSKGFVLDTASDLRWANGMSNHVVEIWIESASVDTAATFTAGTATVTLTKSGSMISASGRPVGSVAAYPYISVKFDHDGGSITVTGLIGAEDFADATWTEGNAIIIDSSVPVVSYLTMTGKCHYEVRRTVSEIGTSKGIENATLAPSDYYPGNAWQIYLDSPAAFGDALTIGGVTYPVDAGSITITTIDGETVDVPIRGMTVLSLIFQDDQDRDIQHIYVNSNEIRAGSPDDAYAVGFVGSWYLQVTLYKVTQSTQKEYTWSIGSFSLDKTGYCMVGILSCIMLMIAAGLYGKKDAAKAGVIIAILGLVAVGYYLLL